MKCHTCTWKDIWTKGGKSAKHESNIDIPWFSHFMAWEEGPWVMMLALAILVCFYFTSHRVHRGIWGIGYRRLQA